MIPTSRRKKITNKKLIIGTAVGVVAIICTIIVIMLIVKGDDQSENNSDESLLGNYNETEQEIVTEESNDVKLPQTDESDEKVAKKREYYIDFVDLAVLKNGSGIFDIHIRFPNGEDYVVVACVEISDITEEGFFVSLDDRENHMLSSARTDALVYTDTTLYLARHTAVVSEAAITDYPWNQFVLSAHGLNEEDKESVYAKRVQLEENLVKFMNQTLNR